MNLKKIKTGLYVNYGTKKVPPSVIKKMARAINKYPWETHSTPEGRVVTGQTIAREKECIKDFFRLEGVRVEIRQDGPLMHYSTGTKCAWVIHRVC